MSRKSLSAELQADVVRRSRRRCCICFGLNRDTSIKQGQIAHLDRNSANDAADNLAFMCLACHDRYDSPSSQSKNFTITEAKSFRSELDRAIEIFFNQPVQFGDASTAPRSSGLSGQYIRTGTGSDSAELLVRQLLNGEVRVIGEALYGTHREYGPNLGQLDFLADVNDNVVVFEDKSITSAKIYRAKFTFSEGSLLVEEESMPPLYFGRNVSFAGTYVKTD